MAKTRRSTTATTLDRAQNKDNGHNIGEGLEQENEGKESLYSLHTITLSTFVRLLGLYPATLEAATRVRITGGERNKKEEDREHVIEGIMEARLELDGWRYERVGVDVDGSGMGDVDDGDVDLGEDPEDEMKANDLKKEKEKACEGRCLAKDDLVRLMEWKLQRGVHRPALLGMIKSNPDKTVEHATRAALAALPRGNPPQQAKPSQGSKNTNPDDQFPQTSLTELMNPLRGVGIATASLVLSAVTANKNGGGIPFFSDDVYLWLCMGEVPRLRSELARESAERVRRRKGCYKRLGGELALKYNIKEYRGLWEAVRDLRGRLLLEIEDGKEELVSCINIEKVAFVLRHVELSALVSEGEEELVSVDRACLGVGETREKKNKKRGNEESIKGEPNAKKRSRG